MITNNQWKRIINKAYDNRNGDFLAAIQREVNKELMMPWNKPEKAKLTYHHKGDYHGNMLSVAGIMVENIESIDIDFSPDHPYGRATIRAAIFTEQDIVLG